MSEGLGDIAVWWINLDRATARRTQMEARLQSLGLEARRFPAVDGKRSPELLSGLLDPEAFRRNMGRAALPAEVGCYLSHISVWEAFIADGREVALVLEDDVHFHDDFLPALSAAMGAMAQWDMLKLNCIRAKLPLRQARVGAWDLNAYLGPATGFGAYLIRRDLALKLLPLMRPMTMPVDYEGTRWFSHDFRLLGLEPFPSHVDDGGVSTITGTNYSEVKKPPRHRRLGNYAMRGGNYFRRLAALLRRGMLFPRR